MVKDATISIAIQQAEHPVSAMFVKYHTVMVDGFMGIEQVLSIKPRLVSHLIQRGLQEGWNPTQKGDFRVEIARQWKKAPIYYPPIA